MTSAIDPTKPVFGNPTTESVRDNFQIAADEITALQEEFNQVTTGTPNLKIGGATTGITYSKQEFKAIKVGRLVVLSVIIRLTSKGSATGDVTLEGMPYAFMNEADYSAVLNIDGNNFASGMGSLPLNLIVANGTTVIFQKFAAGVKANLQDTDITNTLVMRLSGTYIST